MKLSNIQRLVAIMLLMMVHIGVAPVQSVNVNNRLEAEKSIQTMVLEIRDLEKTNTNGKNNHKIDLLNTRIKSIERQFSTKGRISTYKEIDNEIKKALERGKTSTKIETKPALSKTKTKKVEKTVEKINQEFNKQVNKREENEKLAKEVQKAYGNSKSVNVSSKHVLQGDISHYGYSLHGSKTATGGRFNEWGMTAAHKTLPFGSVVRVTNLANGKSIVVRINDRGPYIKGRTFDLSRGAFLKIAPQKQGIIKSKNVKIEVLKIGNNKRKEKQ